MTRGCFITLEGIDGAGKSTHLAWLGERIVARGHAVVTTREPGGTSLGERLRELLLHEPMAHETEALLAFAARREHLAQVIRPALERGTWVLCDRFTDATFAYQGGGHGVSLAQIASLERWIAGDCRPDRTLLFDVDPAVSRERLGQVRNRGGATDKFEREDAAFFDRVRGVYLDRARDDPGRFRVIDSSAAIEVVRERLDAHLDELDAMFTAGNGRL